MARKAWFVLLVSFVLLLAVSSVAYAAATSSYASWTTGGGNTGSQGTPHKDYKLGTVKCAVCHAVHKAPSAGGTAQLLLRTSVGNSCTYCHIDNNLSIGHVYNGDSTAYTPSNNAFAHNGVGVLGQTVTSKCVDCHAVHGANTMDATSISDKILRTSATTASGTLTFQTEASSALLATNERNAQVTVFCTICHPYYQPSHNGTINVGLNHASGDVQNGPFQSHIMTTATAAFNAGGATYNNRVAWVDSSFCRSCHDAGSVNVVGTPGDILNSFPHYTPDYTRFLISRETSSGGAFNTTYTVTYPNTQQNDGVCLKCHVEGSEGVGKTY
jgi:hypothetical protein